MPELPAVAEAGVKDCEVSTWYGVLAPAHTPKAIVTRLHCEIVKICESQWSRAFEHAFSLT